MDRWRVGKRAEQAVERRLRREGWTVLGRNLRLAGVEVDILADGSLIARGEVMVMDGRFCIKVVERISEPR